MPRNSFPTPHVRSKTSAGVVIGIAIALFALMSFVAGKVNNESSAPATLPPASESYQVREEADQFDNGDTTPAIVVFSREDGQTLSPSDKKASQEAIQKMGSIELPESAREQLSGSPNTSIEQGSPLIPLSPELNQAIIGIPNAINGTALGDTVKELRSAGKANLPDNLKMEVTGPAGFAADTASAFDGANFALLGISALVVAVLLILTYRSPILWLIPLIVVALADRLASSAVTVIADHTPLEFDASTAGIMSVLVFGAGTNYALLLISRYREELRRHADARHALSIALKASFAAILSSNLTVVISLLALIAATVPAYASLGAALAIGLLIALAFSLFVLPAALSLAGRRLFWPRIPQVDSAASESGNATANNTSSAANTSSTDNQSAADRQGSENYQPSEIVAGSTARKFSSTASRNTPTNDNGAWYRIARAVVARPIVFLSTMVVVLAALACGLFGTKVGLSTTEQFRTDSEAADGVATISKFVSPGAASPLTVHAPAKDAQAVTAAIKNVSDVNVQGPPQMSKDKSAVSLTVVANAAPATNESYEQVKNLRDAVKAASPEAKVGGLTAETLDTRDATARDTAVVLPMILIIVLVLLMVILRAIVAPVLLLLATSASALAALGAGAFVSQHVFKFPALDVSVPLYSLIFLVALGIDYTVFLVLRAKEETIANTSDTGGANANTTSSANTVNSPNTPEVSSATRRGMTRAVGLTGGVITSAGIVLAAVFAVLGVLPLITLGQIGIVVGLGIVIDTFLVRTLVVPALFSLIGKNMWWPGALAQGSGK